MCIDEATTYNKSVTDTENGNTTTHSQAERIKTRRFKVKIPRFVKVMQTGNPILDYILQNMTYGAQGQSVKLPSEMIETLARDNFVCRRTVLNALSDLEKKNMIFRYIPQKWDVIVVNPYFFRLGSDNDLAELESCITVEIASRRYTFHKDKWDARFKPFLTGDAFEIAEKIKMEKEAKKEAAKCAKNDVYKKRKENTKF